MNCSEEILSNGMSGTVMEEVSVTVLEVSDEEGSEEAFLSSEATQPARRVIVIRDKLIREIIAVSLNFGLDFFM